MNFDAHSEPRVGFEWSEGGIACKSSVSDETRIVSCTRVFMDHFEWVSDAMSNGKPDFPANAPPDLPASTAQMAILMDSVPHSHAPQPTLHGDTKAWLKASQSPKTTQAPAMPRLAEARAEGFEPSTS